MHQLRSIEQAILVGFNTALNDNPALSTRNWFGKNPLRIVVDLNGELPINLKLFNDELPTLVFTLKSKSDTEFVTYIKLNNNKHWLKN